MYTCIYVIYIYIDTSILFVILPRNLVFFYSKIYIYIYML